MILPLLVPLYFISELPLSATPSFIREEEIIIREASPLFNSP